MIIPPKINVARIEELLKISEINGRIIRNIDAFNSINGIIDYDEVYKKLNGFIEYSKNELNDNLKRYL